MLRLHRLNKMLSPFFHESLEVLNLGDDDLRVRNVLFGLTCFFASNLFQVFVANRCLIRFLLDLFNQTALPVFRNQMTVLNKSPSILRSLFLVDIVDTLQRSVVSL